MQPIEAEREFRAQADGLRRWAESMVSEQGWQYGHGEWETGYESWGSVYLSWKALLTTCPPPRWSESLSDVALYVLARDNEGGPLRYALAEVGGDAVAFLAAKAVAAAESCAKYQLVEVLGLLCVGLQPYAAKTNAADFRSTAEPLLIRFASDEDQYVITRALSELARLRSAQVERLALVAWGRATAAATEPDEDLGRHFHMLAILGVLRQIQSRDFEALLREVDASPHQSVRSGGTAFRERESRVR